MMTEKFKHQAAVAAIDEITDGMTVGLGTGSTVKYFIEELGNRVRSGLNITAIATSERSDRLAREVKIPIVSFERHSFLDLTVDGADEVTAQLDLIKGLGGALVREKIVTKASRRVVIVVDESKLVRQLGTRAPIPVEVIPLATLLVADRLEEIGGECEIRLDAGQPFISDNGNQIIDWRYGPISEPDALENRLKLMSGVVDSGIFPGLVHRIIVAGSSGLQEIGRTFGSDNSNFPH